MIQSSNPVLNANVFKNAPRVVGDAMTFGGTIQKTMVCLMLLVLTAMWTWQMTFSGNPIVVNMIMPISIVGLVVAIATTFKRDWSPVLAPAYAAIEGVIIGGISAMYEAQFPGIVMQATFITFGTLFGLLAAYQAGIIKVTQTFRAVVTGAVFGIMILYLASFVMGFFGSSFAFLSDSSPLGLGIGVVIAIVAALTLVLKFDFIDQGVRSGSPKYMEWYSAFGLMVSLIWLYIEVLSLLARFQRR